MKSLNELSSISDINFIEARGVENISCESSGHKKRPIQNESVFIVAAVCLVRLLAELEPTSANWRIRALLE